MGGLVTLGGLCHCRNSCQIRGTCPEPLHPCSLYPACPPASGRIRSGYEGRSFLLAPGRCVLSRFSRVRLFATTWTSAPLGFPGGTSGNEPA